MSIRDMIYHTEAVARIRPDVHVIADMPWMSYHVSDEDAVKNAAALIRAGADSVKVEVRLDQLPTVERILSMRHSSDRSYRAHPSGSVRFRWFQSSSKATRRSGCSRTAG